MLSKNNLTEIGTRSFIVWMGSARKSLAKREEPVSLGNGLSDIRAELSRLEGVAAGSADHEEFGRLVIHRCVMRLIEEGIPLHDIRLCNESELIALTDGQMGVDILREEFSGLSRVSPARQIVRKLLRSVVGKDQQ